MARNVYVTPVTYSLRICHTCDIFGRIRHTLQPNMEHKMCHIRLDLVFLCSPKRICHLTKMRIENEKCNVYVTCVILVRHFFKNKSSYCHIQVVVTVSLSSEKNFFSWRIVFILGHNNTWDKTFKYTILKLTITP